MAEHKDNAGAADSAGASSRANTPQAQRALDEAVERRRARDAAAKERPRELNGRDGPDPARYGDWENKGIASDF